MHINTHPFVTKTYCGPGRKRTPLLAIGCAAAINAMLPGPVVLAQDRQLEEITVTTQRRESTESITAISMEVLTGEDLANQQIKDIIDLQNAVPSLQFFQNGSYVQANIRGVGNPSTGGPSEQVGVPVFFDGATQGEEMALAGGFFDIGDVQVLRGPQATFVGQSAAGGAILVNSARPDFQELGGFIEAQAGTYNTRKVHGALNLPITDTLAARIAFMTDTRDSFYDNVSGAISTGGQSNTPGDQTDSNYRITLLWEPDDQFSLFAKAEQTHLEANGIPQQPNPRPYTGFWDNDMDPSTPSIPVTSYGARSQGPAPGTGFLAMRDHDGNPDTPPVEALFGGTPGAGGELYDPLDPFSIDRRVENFRIQKNTRLSLEMNYTLNNGITLRSLTSSIQMDRLQAEASDSAAFQDLTGFHLGPGMLTWSQEFNIISPDDQRLRWLLGAYHSDRHTELSLNIPLDNPVCGWQYDSSWTPCPTSGESQTRLYWTSIDDVKHTGFYAQMNYDITEELELTLEGRLNDDDNVQLRQLEVPVVQDLLPFPPFANNTVLCPGQINGSTFYCSPNAGDVENFPTSPPLVWKDDITTYKVGLNWEPWDNHFFYAFFARGYKSGQSIFEGAPPVSEEVVDDFEFGWKGTLLDGRLYAELGYFDMDYKDMQLSSFVTGIDQSGVAVRNAGSSSNQGFEGSFRFFIGNLGLNGSYGYVDSKLGAITTLDTRALPIPSPGLGSPWPGDTSKGCTGDFCFDYSPYIVTLSGAEGLFAPQVTYSFGADYAFQLRNGAILTPALSFNHSDESNSSIIQQPGDSYYLSEERNLLNFTMTYIKDNWNVQLFGTNVTDEVFIEGISGDSVLYGDPEVWGIRARMDF
jgi:iron complex outermembrane receptor protein